MPIRVIANNDMAYLWWNHEGKIPGCLGFSIRRTDTASGKVTTLPSWVGFEADPNREREVRDTDVWPIQKFQWKDVTAPRGGTYRYRVVPMVGEPGALREELGLAIESEAVTLDPRLGTVNVWFNRGIVSTQALSAALPKDSNGRPRVTVLRDRIDQPGDSLRNRLKGRIDEALLELLRRADRDGGECFAALYELNDVELLQALLESERVHLILSNTGEDDGVNEGSRQALHDAGKDITDRFLSHSGKPIGHNKFIVYVDAGGVPKSVLTGSTNWTATGLCTQSNNALLIESEETASRYYAYWKALKKDDAEQGEALRKLGARKKEWVKLGDGDGRLRIWFSPNTSQKKKPKDPETPPDLEEVFDLIAKARRGVLFLAFIPGTPSVITELKSIYAERQREGRRLFVRGAVTDRSAAEGFKVDLFHRSMKSDARVTSYAGIQDEFSYWQKELDKVGFAVIHDKVVVIDPFDDECAVVTGSHNLGFKASYSNDENLVVIRGNRRVAQAYAAHVLDLYDHFRWRYNLLRRRGRGRSAWADLDETDRWQDKYFDNQDPASAEMVFWGASDG